MRVGDRVLGEGEVIHIVGKKPESYFTPVFGVYTLCGDYYLRSWEEPTSGTICPLCEMLYRQGLQIDRRDVPFYSSPGEVKKLYVKAEIGYYVVYESPLDRIYPAPYSRPVFPGEKRIDLEARPVIVNFEESEYEEVLEDSVPLVKLLSLYTASSPIK